MHGTRRPLAAGQLGHLRISLMHSARPSIPLRRPSPALSRTCRPLSFASRAPHALPSYLCTRCQQVSRSEGLVGSGGWAQEGRLAGYWAGEWLQSGCRPQVPDPDGSMLAWPQVPTLDCCLCLLLSMFHYTHSCASKSGMVHTHVGMPSQACVSISNQAQIKSNQVLHTIPKAHFTTRHPSNDNTSTPKNAHKQTS